MCVLSQYERGRELADFVKFLNDKCGTHRLPGGKLNSHVRPPLSYIVYRLVMRTVCNLQSAGANILLITNITCVCVSVGRGGGGGGGCSARVYVHQTLGTLSH